MMIKMRLEVQGHLIINKIRAMQTNRQPVIEQHLLIQMPQSMKKWFHKMIVWKKWNRKKYHNKD